MTSSRNPEVTVCPWTVVKVDHDLVTSSVTRMWRHRPYTRFMLVFRPQFLVPF